MIGRTLSHYQILEEIAAGGMGVVYRARDERLKREVAVKVLPAEALADEASRRHFRREALTLSQLSHPNIGTIFDFDSQDGLDFLVMELVGGMSLEDKVQAGPLPEREILALGVQIAEALEAAHAKGIVHRDLKPANIGVTPDGHVKVIDFGLAQLLRPVKGDTTTESFHETEGIAGTLPYMAPEQLLGERVDGRADLFSLGVVLYRMAAGRLPFEQKLSTALVEAILHSAPPPPAQINHKVSARLEEIIVRCLEKDPEDRYQTAADLRADLNRLKRQTESGVAGVSGGWSGTAGRRTATQMSPRSGAMVAIAVFTVVAAGVVIGILWHPKPPPPPVPTYRQLTFIGNVVDPAISPDGRSFAYVDHTRDDRDRIMVQDIGDGQPLEIFTASQCLRLKWAPDGSAVLCIAVKDSLARSFLIPRLGGSPRIYSTVGRALAWAPDGSRFVAVFGSGRRLIFTDRSTADTTSVFLGEAFPSPDDVDWSPSGDQLVLHTVSDHGRHALWTMRPYRDQPRLIFESETAIQSPRWSPRGDAIYFLRVNGSTMNLCKLAINPRGRKPRTPPRVVLAGIQMGAALTFSSNGSRMLYARELVQSNLWSFKRRSSSGNRIAIPAQLTSGTSFDGSPQISPDGRWVAFAKGDRSPANIFVLPVEGGDERQITFMKSMNVCPVWSPRGDEIAFGSDDGGAWRIWRASLHGTTAEVISRSRPAEGLGVSLAWAPGNRIVYQAPGAAFSVLDPVTGEERQLLTPDSIAQVLSPQWSPGGDRIAFLRWLDTFRAGIWVLSTADKSVACAYDGSPMYPIGWSKDARWIYAWDHRESEDLIMQVASDGGGQRVVMELPRKGRILNPVITPDGSRVVASMITRQTDVWLVEDFDRYSK